MFGTTKRDFGYFECTIPNNVFFEVIDDVTTDIASIIGSVVAVTLALVVVMIGILIRKRNRRYFNLIWLSNVNCIYYPNGLWWPTSIWMRSSLTLGSYKAMWETQVSWQKYYNLYVKFSNFLSMPNWQIAVFGILSEWTKIGSSLNRKRNAM